MKRKVILCGIVTLLLGTSVATAANYRLNGKDARHAADERAIRTCHRSTECIDYAVGTCSRINVRRINCAVRYAFGFSAPVACDQTIKIGIENGFVKIKSVSEMLC